MSPTVFAMKHPITTLMLVVGLISGGGLAYSRMKVDIFPSLNTPQIYVFLDYVGMSPAQIEGFIVNQLELYFQYVDGIKEIDSRNIQQVSLCKLSFFPGTDMGQAMAQVVAMSNRAMSWMPKGTLPPMIMRMDAGSVPVGYLVLESKEATLGQLGDWAQNLIRPQVQKNVPGTVAISPFGPNMRSIIVRVDPHKLLDYNLTPQQILDALANGNNIIPAGNVYIKDAMPVVENNATVVNPQRLGEIPLKAGQNVMSFGSLTPIAVRLVGTDLADVRKHAEKIAAEMKRIPYLRDVQFEQTLDYPTIEVEIDREKAGLSGATVEHVRKGLVMATSSTRFTDLNYWVDIRTGFDYLVEVLIPPTKMTRAQDVELLPVDQVNPLVNLMVRDVTAAGTKLLEELVQRAKRQGIDAQHRLVTGKGWHELVRQVLRDKHDLVVVGTRDLTGLRRMLFGNTAMKLLRRCPCPVLVTKVGTDLAPLNILIATDLKPASEALLKLGIALGRQANAHVHVLHVAECSGVFSPKQRAPVFPARWA